MEEIDPSSFYYRQLLQEFPNSSKFYIEQDEGDYYNRAKTLFYDENKILIRVKTHDYYG